MSTTTAIVDRGRGPEIAGTRITVYDILDYTKHNWHPNSIAILFGLSTEQVLAAIRYIEAHEAEVMSEYQEMLEREAQGNSPEVQAKLEASHKKLQAWLKQRPREKGREGGDGRNLGGSTEKNGEGILADVNIEGQFARPE